MRRNCNKCNNRRSHSRLAQPRRPEAAVGEAQRAAHPEAAEETPRAARRLEAAVAGETLAAASPMAVAGPMAGGRLAGGRPTAAARAESPAAAEESPAAPAPADTSSIAVALLMAGSATAFFPRDRRRVTGILGLAWRPSIARPGRERSPSSSPSAEMPARRISSDAPLLRGGLRVADARVLFFRQAPTERGGMGAGLFSVLRAGDGNDARVFGQEPVDRDLSDGHLTRVRDPLELAEERLQPLVCWQQRRRREQAPDEGFAAFMPSPEGSSNAMRANERRAEGIAAALDENFPVKIPRSRGAERDQRDVQLATSVQHPVSLGAAVQQAIMHLIEAKAMP